MFVFKAAVVGAGTMGGQIAQTIAAAGIPVVLKDVKPGARRRRADRGPQRHRRARSAAWSRRGSSPRSRPTRRSTRSSAASTARRPTTGFGDVDFVIEAVPERMEIKQAVFAELDAVTPGHAILASNTSSLSITEIGEATLRPDKVVGFHYFYPASVMPLIEIVQGDDTSDETVPGGGQLRPGDQEAADHLRRGPGLRRQPHPQLRRSARSGAPRRSRACRSRRSTRRVGAANVVPMGPFLLIDLLGLDTVLHVAEHLARVLRRPLLRPPGHAAARRGGQARRQDRRRGLLRRRRAEPRRRRSERRRRASSPSCWR